MFDFVFLGKKIYKGAANIGFAPTFHTKRRAVEVHIIGFKGNIYGKKIKMEFEERLRGEKVFKSARELAIQIRKDVEKIKRIFK